MENGPPHVTSSVTKKSALALADCADTGAYGCRECRRNRKGAEFQVRAPRPLVALFSFHLPCGFWVFSSAGFVHSACHIPHSASLNSVSLPRADPGTRGTKPARGKHMDSTREAPSFEIVKRDGRSEEYNEAKLVRSLTRAGVAPFMLAGILHSVTPNPDQDTRALRASVESELEQWQPAAARRYAQTRRLRAFGSGAFALGSVSLRPETAERFGTRHGDTLWLGENGAWVPLVVETRAQIEPDQAWLHSAILADMGTNPGARIPATRVFPGMPRRDVLSAQVARQDMSVPASPR